MEELYPEEESSSCCRMRPLCSRATDDDVADSAVLVLKILWRVVLGVDSVVIPDVVVVVVVVVTPTLVRMNSSSASGAEKGDVPSSLLVALFHAPI